MSEYYKAIEKIECNSTHRYYVCGVPDCFSGFFSRSETGTSNVVSKIKNGSYPGSSKDPNTEVRLCGVKYLLSGKKYECSVQLYVVRNYDFKTILVTKMNPISSE